MARSNYLNIISCLLLEIAGLTDLVQATRVRGRHSKLLHDISELNSLGIFTDMSTKSACPPCAEQIRGDRAERITNDLCPGADPAARSGDYAQTTQLCRGCCYRIQDTGPNGDGSNGGEYVTATAGSEYTCTYTLQIPSQKPANVTLDADRFVIPFENRQMICPRDSLTISGLDETIEPAVSNQFPEDTGLANNDGVMLCGRLDQTYSYSSKPGEDIGVVFKVADDNQVAKGFVLEICVDP